MRFYPWAVGTILGGMIRPGHLTDRRGNDVGLSVRRRRTPVDEQIRGCERVPTGTCGVSGGLAAVLRAPFAQEPMQVPAELGECLKTVTARIELPRTLARRYARCPRG